MFENQRQNTHSREIYINIQQKILKMASTVPNKVFIQVESTKEQQENIKVSRKSSRTLAVIQKTGTIDKENLVGRQPAFIAKEQLIKKTITDK